MFLRNSSKYSSDFNSTWYNYKIRFFCLADISCFISIPLGTIIRKQNCIIIAEVHNFNSTWYNYKYIDQLGGHSWFDNFNSTWYNYKPIRYILPVMGLYYFNSTWYNYKYKSEWNNATYLSNFNSTWYNYKIKFKFVSIFVCIISIPLGTIISFCSLSTNSTTCRISIPLGTIIRKYSLFILFLVYKISIPLGTIISSFSRPSDFSRANFNSTWYNYKDRSNYWCRKVYYISIPLGTIIRFVIIALINRIN